VAGIAAPIVAASDNVRLVAEQIRPWIPGRYVTLGTDGFGRSDSRAALRKHFGISANHIAFATLTALATEGNFERDRLDDAMVELGINPDEVDPIIA
jgi:pyruvate dehydrogenase E1 component